MATPCWVNCLLRQAATLVTVSFLGNVGGVGPPAWSAAS
jgi:hypothetical protein